MFSILWVYFHILQACYHKFSKIAIKIFVLAICLCSIIVTLLLQEYSSVLQVEYSNILHIFLRNVLALYEIASITLYDYKLFYNLNWKLRIVYKASLSLATIIDNAIHFLPSFYCYPSVQITLHGIGLHDGFDSFACIISFI